MRRRRGAAASGISGHGFGSSAPGGGSGAARRRREPGGEPLVGGVPVDRLRPYLTHSGDAATAASITAGSTGAISERGARSIVHATGVGEPRSESTVTAASPVPSDVSISAMS